MIRADVLAFVKRWQSMLIWLVASILFFFLASQMFGFMKYIVAAPACVSLVFAYGAFQRVRFSGDGQATGTIEIDEGVISYLSPFGGGHVEVSALETITLVPTQLGQAQWELRTADNVLRIPVNAHNVEALFDAFMMLPKFETTKMLAQIKKTPSEPVVIWNKQPITLH